MSIDEYLDQEASRASVIGISDASGQHLDSCLRRNHPHYRFTELLNRFIRSLVPSQLDIQIRQYFIKLLRTRIEAAFPKGGPNRILVLPCGSCVNGTFLPGSDIDLIVYQYPYPFEGGDPLVHLQDRLRDIMSCVPALVSTTETPVLKFSVSPGIQIDLTADSANSALAVPWIRGVFNKFPILWPTQLFLKALLRRRNLHETYKGGITSYPLLLMCLAYLQYQGPGESLLDFITKLCHFYGNKFNPVLVGIDVRGNGCFFPRTDDHMYGRSPAAPYIRDPLDPANVLGTSSFRMPEIVKLFRETHQQFEKKDGRLFDDFAALIGEFEAKRRVFADFAREHRIDAEPA